MTFLTDTELDRETAIRRYVCSTCHAERNRPCRLLSNTDRALDVAHTSRYLKGVPSGLVPPLPGGRGA